jgi:hypothetical protein
MKSEVQSTITQHWQREISRSRSSPEFRQLKLARRPTITYYGFAGAGMSFLLDQAGGNGTGPHRTAEGYIFRSPRRLSMSLYLRGSAEHKQRHLPATVRYEKIGSFPAITPWPATQGFRLMSVFEPAPTEANPDHKKRTGEKLVLEVGSV